ncbi:hypothetical protein A2727_00130 [Candidatus Nomurabacteria bacterium RIFCSPHIGHO2_01_FULL_37_110]|nr:MAG: hypothetical protein A2727_00130 [Candidatus Nomurabacteria bacterium RIFCSPHIGHO2_01_FULL_37_110]OGI84815.1 MAG: hypothetical protein A3A92_00560 [Candidatus Nomurabacteria bacterium RIFCSPLOWO2_01_FULL_37_49]
MTESIEWLRLLIIDHRSLEYIIVFFGALLGGELALFTLGFLAAQKILSIFPVFILSFLATYPSNILWFLLAQTDTVRKIVAHRYANTTISIISEAVNKISRGNHYIGLIFAKFLVGTPIILIMYVNKNRLSLKEFFIYETPAVLLSLLVIIPIGYLSGLGFSYLADIFNNLYAAIGFIIFIAIVVAVAQSWLKSKFTNIEN